MDRAISPIGVLDSGVGGVYVLRQAVRLMPRENFIFYGDLGNAPYGSRPLEEIRRISLAAAQRLAGQGVKADVYKRQVVISHLHFDHMGELPLLGYALQGRGKRLPVYLPDQPASAYGLLGSFDCFQRQPVKPGDTVSLGTLKMSFLPARHPVPAVGIVLEAEGKKLCYTGDTNQFPGMAAAYSGADLLLIDGGSVSYTHLKLTKRRG